MDGDKERGEEASKGGGWRLEGKEAKECLMNHPIFLARKQNLLEAPTQQMCAYVCLAQLTTWPSLLRRGSAQGWFWGDSHPNYLYKPMVHRLQVKTVLPQQAQWGSAGLLDSFRAELEAKSDAQESPSNLFCHCPASSAWLTWKRLLGSAFSISLWASLIQQEFIHCADAWHPCIHGEKIPVNEPNSVPVV